MAGFNLRAFLEAFPEVSRAVFGQTFNLRKLERDFAYLRKESNWLTIGHVTKLLDPTSVPHARNWPSPDIKHLDAVLRERRLHLAPLDGDKSVVGNLLRTLHNLGLVSVILRLVYPEKYAIFSGPVANLLQVQHAGAIDLYLAFCQELLEWQKHFRMGTVAETETALWCFYHISNHAGERAEDAREAFEADIWIQRRRLARVLDPFLRRYGPLELARLLAEANPKLAGKIAGEEYERMLLAAAAAFYPAISVRNKGWAVTVINLLAQDGHVPLEEKVILHRVWGVRNAAVHGEGAPGLAEIENMIDSIERISRRWERDKTFASSKVLAE